MTERDVSGPDRPERFGALPVDPDSQPPSGRPFHLHAEPLLLVLLGGAGGTAARYTIEEALPTANSGWPVATLIVNLLGAVLLGALLESLARLGPDTEWRRRARVLLGTGVCGAFTTYSTLALETTLLARDHAVGQAIGYAGGSVVGGIVAVWAGVMAAGVFRRRSEVPS